MSAGYEAYEAMSDAERIEFLWRWIKLDQAELRRLSTGGYQSVVSWYPTVEGPDRACVLLDETWPIGTTVTVTRTTGGE